MSLRTLASALHENESGQDLIEYALLCALLALAATATIGTIGDMINNAFLKIGNNLTNATT